jgi:hypothetical protein
VASENVTGSAEITEGANVTIRARLTDDAGNVILRSDVAAGNEARIFDLDNAGAALVSIGSITAAALFGTALSTTGWTADSTGFALSYTFAAPALEGGKRYRAEIKVNTTSSGVIIVQADLLCRPTLTL